jgi:hypothetical protein
LLASSDPAQQALNRNPDMKLMFIRSSGMPAYYLLSNENAARTVRTWDVWPAGVGGGFYSLTGSTTAAGELGIWDGGGVYTTHAEFGGRVTQQDAPGSIIQHATHVAGTMVAAGINTSARGMSYQALLHAYDWDFDTAEMAAAGANGMQVSNHSYAYAAGWESNYWWGDITVSSAEDYGFGYYDSTAMDVDNVAYNAPYYLVCIAAGNDRNDSWVGTHYHWDGAWVLSNDAHGADYQNGGYDTISWTGNAKNPLLVGAVNDIPAGYVDPTSVVLTPFSSWGPTDDGRIKPDIVANGQGLVSTNASAITPYATLSGTSMAAPNASGSVNLIAQEYEAQFGTRPRSSTLKAIVVNAADEAGAADGPDYANGWGLLNTYRAIEILHYQSDEAGGVFERTLNTGETHEYDFTVDAPQDVRLTIAWTDPPGTPPAPAVDPAAIMLVNDLDLRITHVATVVTTYPWRLDRTSPSSAATRGDNSIDNVESIDIDNAPAGEYHVTVNHKGALGSGAQGYGMVWRGLRSTPTPVGPGRVSAPKFELDAPYPNPIHEQATIGFTLDAGEAVSMHVYDASGRRVATLLERAARPAGAGSVALDARRLASGVYFVRMQTPTRSVSRKITIVR